MRKVAVVAVVLGLLNACGTPMRASDDDTGSPGESVDGGSHDKTPPDAASSVVPCVASPWSITTVRQWHPSDGTAIPLQPELRMQPAGLEATYATNPSGGEQRQLALRAADSTWSFETEGTRVMGTVARVVDSHGLETECWNDGPAVVSSATQILFSCRSRTGGGAWTTAQLASNTTLPSASMVVDHADRVHLTYRSAANTDSYAWRDPGGTWTSAPLAGRGMNAFSPLAVDAAGCVHMARSVIDNGVPAYALQHGTRCPGATSWTWEVITRLTSPAVPSAHSLAFDTAGDLHFIYASAYNTTNGALYHAVRKVDGTWTIATPDGTGIVIGQSLSISADRSGGVWLGFMPKTGDLTADKVVLHIAADGTMTRHSFGEAQYGGSIVTLVDPSGQVHVMIDSDWKRLEYATMCPPGPITL